MITFTQTNGQIHVHSPYHPEFPAKARALGGKWESGAWTFDARRIDLVRQALRSVYYYDDQECQKVDIEVRADARISEGTDPLTSFGRVIASAWGRDSGAKVGEGVAVLSGRFGSGGSAKNWLTYGSADLVFRVYDVPRAAVVDVYENWSVEILSETPAPTATLVITEGQTTTVRQGDQAILTVQHPAGMTVAEMIALLGKA